MILQFLLFPAVWSLVEGVSGYLGPLEIHSNPQVSVENPSQQQQQQQHDCPDSAATSSV